MKSKKDLRNNAFIVNLTSDEAEKLKQLAEANEHAQSTQLYLIIKKYLSNIYLKDNDGNTIIKI